MSFMDEQRTPGETTGPPPEETVDQPHDEREGEARQETRERVRGFIERHRETFDELAK